MSTPRRRREVARLRRAAPLLVAPLLALAAARAGAQAPRTDGPAIVADVSVGFARTALPTATQRALASALGGSVDRSSGGTLGFAFYRFAHPAARLGIGARIQGAFGSAVRGPLGSDYVFNGYQVGPSVRWLPRGRGGATPYLRGDLGFGQFTAKRADEASRRYVHQYGIGTTVALGAGLERVAPRIPVGLELHVGASSRSGTVDGIGDRTFRSGQVGIAAVWHLR